VDFEKPRAASACAKNLGALLQRLLISVLPLMAAAKRAME
jgi:hypothetical protein